MSRDFVPLERFWSNKTSGDNLWLQNMTIDYGHGRVKKLFTDEEQAARLRYPNIAVAMCDVFVSFRKACPKENREKHLARLESLQIKMQDAWCNEQKSHGNDYETCDVPQPMKDWFMGRLLPDPYDSSYNDREYLFWLKEELKKEGGIFS